MADVYDNQHEYSMTALIGGLIVAALLILIGTPAACDVRETQLQRELDKAAVSAGLCQVPEAANAGNGWPHYSWQKCK